MNELGILEEFANRLIKYYRTLKGDTNGYAVAYHIEQVKKELLERGDKDECRVE